MQYKTSVLDEAARRHTRYYLRKLTKLKEDYQSTPESAVPTLRKIMPQVQQAHTWLLNRRDADLSHAEMLVEMTAAGMGCVRMVVSPGEWEKWIEAGVMAAAQAERDLDRLDFIIEQGVHAFRQGDLESAQAFAEAGDKVATSLDDLGRRGQCFYLQALVCQKRGQTEAAQHAVSRAQQDYEQVGDKTGLGKVHSFLAQAAIDVLDYERAYDLLEKNIRLWEEMGDLRQMAVEQYQLGVMLGNQLLYSEADKHLLAARETFKHLADRRYEAYSLQILAFNAIECDAFDTALAYIEEAHELFLAVNDQRGVAGALNYTGRIYSKQGDRKQAIEAHQRAAEVARAVDYRFALTDAHRSMCEIHLKMGNLAAAQHNIQIAVLVGETSGNRLLLLAVLSAAVGVLVADERPSVAAEVAQAIQTATDEPLILQMLAPHIATLDTDVETLLTIDEATETIKNLYQ